MRNIMKVFVCCTLILLILYCCNNPSPPDPAETSTCEYDWESGWDVLSHSHGSDVVENEVNTVFSKVGSTYLSTWNWFYDTDHIITDISYLYFWWEGEYYITDNNGALIQFAKDHKDESGIEYHFI